jgi:hypothetical protein
MAEPLAPGEVAFHDRDVPAFPAGRYQISVSQTLSVADGSSLGSVLQDVEVRGPQFAIEDGEISARFPPDSATGDFSAALPHAVLTEPTLPWERGVNGTPWLALLVLDDTEIVSVTSVTVSDLLRADPDVTKPAIDVASLSAASLAAPCTQLVLRTDLFRAVVPRAAELPYLAHVRSANLSGQQSGGTTEQGTFAVVLSARFPASAAAPGTGGTRNHVHLVSLEGLDALLTEQGPGAGGPAHVALASLTSWSFTSAKAGGGTFADLTIKLAGPDPAGFLLRVPPPAPGGSAPTPPQQAVLARLAEGYLPLIYATASGEESFAWYRGPCTPVVPQPLPAKPAPGRYTSADQATIYVAAEGIFDVSYAAAWNLGRALGLADRSFATALYGFRRTAHQLTDLALSRTPVLYPAAGGALGALADPASLVAANPVTAAFGTLLGGGMGGTVQAAVTALNATTGTAAPAVAPAPPPPPAPPTTQVRAFLGQQAGLDVISTAVQSAARDGIAAIATRLAALLRLEGVPFPHLVPSQAMLPAESIRFFYLDPGWTGALADGALSVAVESSRDQYVQQAFEAVLDQAVTQALAGGRPVAGLLLRSAVVAGWPGLTVTALAKGAAVGIPVITRPSPDVLLCLFAAVPDTVHLDEPSHSLRFGAQDGAVLELRSTVPPVGKQLPDSRFPATGDLSQFFRPGPPGRVLSISPLVQALTARLGGHVLGAADLAVQLVQEPERLSFHPQGTP